MKVEISTGELWDKLSILRIKLKYITDQQKRNHIGDELVELVQHMKLCNYSNPLWVKLIEVNDAIWNVEDQIRKKEKENKFDKEFIELARDVYHLNDKRAEIKRLINIETKSTLVEEKQHVNYKE